MKPNHVYSLARWFVTEYLRQEWDTRRAGLYLRHAKLLLNPKVDGQKAYTEEEVKACFAAIDDKLFLDSHKRPTMLLAALYGTPPFIERMKDIKGYLPPRPPIYEKTSLQQWQEKYGKYLKGGASESS